MNLSRDFANGEGREFSYINIVREDDLSVFLEQEAKRYYIPSYVSVEST